MQRENPYPQQQGKNDDMNALVGRSLGQFRIVERIGAGGMATVFKAYQPNLDRYVAIKVLPAYHARDPVFVKRFVQEARAVAKLVHPNILQIHDFGEQDNITYIVMEYVEGGTLKDRLKHPMAVPDAVDYMIQAAEGLNCAHNNGIVHRDVKPANMLLRKDGYLLLSDFGIAKILEGTTNLTRVGTGIGTPQYMSPEQGTGQAVDRRSDIYSLGIVLFHCLAGRVPFTAENPLSITVKHLNDPLPVEMLRTAAVPAPIEQVVLKMAAKAPQDRYQTTDELISALTGALANSHLSMPPRWRPGMSSAIPQIDSQGSAMATPGNSSGQGREGREGREGRGSFVEQKVPVQQGNNNQQQIVTLPCFRCGASNPSTRLYCTSCGDELSDRRAIHDRYLGQNGRPVLARLTIQNGPMGGHSYRFHQVVTTIGRTNGNDLIIQGRTVSRRHARLFFDNGRWYLEDLQSANGTLVNNMRVYQPVALNDGDVINFGDEIVVFNTTY
ncbi:MAG TPA: FHA domain-containing serine/threonine-protein kinase [Ktedonobacteraceae bacterium]|nr:FHA domain-containing serine/threonine-protein kinase [Ktedonobacteraceae bacterium]